MKPQETLALLGKYESRNVTYIEPDGSWPIVWEQARGVHVWDAAGKKYLDLTAAFGVVAAGHCNPRVARAGAKQMKRLMHAMGDVHPHELKARLARELSRRSFERWTSGRSRAESITGKTIFCNSGFEAVEAALKTTMLATGKPGVIAFEGGYHGLGYGALTATHREHFRFPFHRQLREFAEFAPFPTSRKDLEACERKMAHLLRRRNVGAVLAEPIQGRGGIRIPPKEFLKTLRRLCDDHGALLILDEIYTGFGRTGKWFACEYSSTVPDLICLGKALTGGFPLSACVGRADLMDLAWPRSSGEAIHTSTFLGNPVGCAMAMAQMKEIEARDLVQRSAHLGKFLLTCLESRFSKFNPQVEIRGLGLLACLELRLPDGTPATEMAVDAVKRMLHRGYVFLPEGEHANIISFSPPLSITRQQLQRTVDALAEILNSEQ
jgi:4-aminobutyrate aminotransferase-like enzyme